MRIRFRDELRGECRNALLLYDGVAARCHGMSRFELERDEFVTKYQAAVPNTFRIVHACDIVPILPAANFAVGALSIQAAHVTENVVNFCAQTGDVGCNHACATTYLPYVTGLPASQW